MICTEMLWNGVMIFMLPILKSLYYLIRLGLLTEAEGCYVEEVFIELPCSVVLQAGRVMNRLTGDQKLGSEWSLDILFCDQGICFIKE